MGAGPFRFVIIGLWLCLAGACASEAPIDDADQNIRETLEASLAAHGGYDLFLREGLTLDLEGEFDLTTRMQGRSPTAAEPTPVTERITIAPNLTKLAYRYDGYNYYGSHQIRREIMDDPRRILFIDEQTLAGGYLPRQTVSDHKLRYARYMPQYLLADLIENADCTWARAGTGPYCTKGGDRLELEFDDRSGLLNSAYMALEIPLKGRTQIEWSWHYYTFDDGIAYPGRFEIRLGGRLMKTVNMSVSPGIDTSDFKTGGYRLGPPPEQLALLSDFEPYGERSPEVETLMENVYLIRNLRPGFAVLFVDIGDSVVAIDAPTGWFEMNQIPPMSWSPGDDIDALGEKYLRAINATLPGKPVSHLVLTHHHSDHIGGLRPMVRSGAKIVAGREAFSVVSGLLSSADLTPEYDIVSDRLTIDGDQPVELIALPKGNPKADGFLMVHLPKEKLLYATGFIYPLPEAVFPPPESVYLSQYFVDWLDTSGLDIEHIYNLHGMAKVEDWHLETLRQMKRAAPK